MPRTYSSTIGPGVFNTPGRSPLNVSETFSFVMRYHIVITTFPQTSLCGIAECEIVRLRVVSLVKGSWFCGWH